MKIDQILDEYRQGDANKRMSLFLYYRGLRDEFTCIEEDNSRDLPAGCHEEAPVRLRMLPKVLSRLFRPNASVIRAKQ